MTVIESMSVIGLYESNAFTGDADVVTAVQNKNGR